MLKRYQAAYRKLLLNQNPNSPLQAQTPRSRARAKRRLTQMLNRLGNPERRFRHIQVTGTSGKGSVTYLLHHLLSQAGQRVGSYTLPHTTTYLERFHINNQLADPKLVTRAIETVLTEHAKHIRAGHERLKLVELNICIAWLVCAWSKVDWCVLESGLVSNFVAAEVAPRLAAAVITNIDLDHTHALRPHVAAIARDKSHIIQPGCVAITGETKPACVNIIKARARQVGALLITIPRGQRDHNQHNADLAQAVGQVLGIPERVIKASLKNPPRLPARLETMSTHPRIILDGAHNPAKIKASLEMFKGQLGTGRLLVIFGCKQDKDAKTMLRYVSAVADKVMTTAFVPGKGQAADPQKLLAFMPAKKRGQAYASGERALEAVLQEAKKSDTILITGSLYLAGDLRAHFRPEKIILHERQS